MAVGKYPNLTRSKVNRAGKAVRRATANDDDIEIIKSWRASHSHIINTFQANLRRRTRDTNIIVGQRLKRLPTIMDKLRREPTMSLPKMHDIAGCRVIFPNNDRLREFRENFIKSRANHKRITAEYDQFNYLNKPKGTGYRGVHDVYSYIADAESATPWNGLLIEIQYRTKAQHAWATAVETADLLTKSRGKFSEANTNYMTFFQVCSEIISRTHEDSKSCLYNVADKSLIEMYDNSLSQNNIMRILKTTNEVGKKQISGIVKPGRNTILVYMHNADEDGIILKYSTLTTTRAALARYEQLEKKYENVADVVLVRSEDTKSLRAVFQNYFADTREFVKLVESGAAKLRSN